MDEPSLEERLALVLRGVQRMADGLGGIETRLTDVATKAEEHLSLIHI